MPIILKHLYLKKTNYEESILNLINMILEPKSENIDVLALNASFLDLAYTFLLSTIRIIKNNKEGENTVKIKKRFWRVIVF